MKARLYSYSSRQLNHIPVTEVYIVGTTLYLQCDIPHYHDTGNIQVHLDTNVNSSYLNVLSTQHSLPSTDTALKDIITAPY
jgi:hypothetical protein